MLTKPYEKSQNELSASTFQELRLSYHWKQFITLLYSLNMSKDT